ncbi:MAG: NUDIX hydrolase [Thermoleophilia bacterium]|jgi:8-oxo-dGTP diphosphatase|nr:NUDIX hydrolase [Thermoleophilia bacterium]
MAAVWVELVVFTVRDRRLEVLLVRRPGTTWALPSAPRPERGASLEQAALAALSAQAGVRGIRVEQLYTFDRDDGVAVAYLALIDAGRHPLSPGPDEVDVRWFVHDDLPATEPDQETAVHVGRARLRAKTRYAPVAVQLMPETFTIGELQAAYEAVLDERLDARNFRRDVLAAGVVEPVGETRSEGRGRPAQLYRSRPRPFAVIAGERRAARAITGQG